MPGKSIQDGGGDPNRNDTRAVGGGSDPVHLAAKFRESSVDRQPEWVGPYRVLRVLGEGGMGTVYLAEQTRPVHRRVALKMVKLGMDTKQTLARFETEREALALMNHTGVAQVFDAGVSDQGRPYFAMEYVPGIPITEYCDKHKLSTKERLELFARVCDAVQHAHQKGIIHRDIKPSNVLVSVEGESVLPKVIDFGVAKATQHRLTEQTLFTEQGQLIGTPGYMSPEQAEMTALDIDTRTDIYSLGVLLYELLIGVRPFDDEGLRRCGIAEIQRIIREVDPPKPSTRLSGLGPDSTKVAANRQTEIRSLSRVLRGDLDWVVMRCLEKNRNRRYASANDLRMEIQRYLANQPVLAGPPGPIYRMRKFLHRRWRGVLAGSAVAACLIVVAFAAVRTTRASAREQGFRSLMAAHEAAQRLDTAQMLVHSNAALSADPSLTMAYALRAKAYTHLGKLEAARVDCDRALLLDPTHSLALRTKAFYLLERGDFAGALEHYNRGIPDFGSTGLLAKEFPEDLHNRARIHRIQGNLEAALIDHDRAVALAWKDAMAYLGRGVTRRISGDDDGAIADFREAAGLQEKWVLQCRQWEWEIRMLRDGPQDRLLAAAALTDARDHARTDLDKAILGISTGATGEADALKACGQSERLKAVALYYLGVKRIVDGDRANGEAAMRACVDKNEHDLPEYDFAKWHLSRVAGSASIGPKTRSNGR